MFPKLRCFKPKRMTGRLFPSGPFFCYTQKEGNKVGRRMSMYFMNICTWEPEDERRVEEIRKKWKWPKEVKVVCEFMDLQGGRAINVVDTDAKGLIACRSAWLHVMKLETFPV